MHRLHKSNKKKVLITSLLVSLILAVIAAAYWYTQKDTESTSPATSNGTPEETDVNFNPPTEQEQQAGDDQKDKLLQEEANRNNNQNGLNASVIITDAGQYADIIEVRAFIPDHYEDGTCTITFTLGSQKVVKEAPAYRDSSTTICTNPLIKRSEFPVAGDWQLIVSYSSTGASGQSQAQKVTIN